MENKRLNKIIIVICFFNVFYIQSIVPYDYNRHNSNIYASQNENTEGAKKITNETDNVNSQNESSKRIYKISAKTQILTVDSTPVLWPEFHFWLNYIKKYYRKTHNLNKITDWSVKQNGMSLNNFFLSSAIGYVCKDKAIEAKAKELGIELSKDDLTEIEKNREKNIKIYGRLEYIRIVSRMYISEEAFDYLTKIDYLTKNIFKYMYGVNGEKCTDRDVSSFVKERGYMCAKYIFLSNADTDGRKLSAEENAKNCKLFEDILNHLSSSNAPQLLFDTLINDYYRDNTNLIYNGGFLFVSGGMGRDFEIAYLKLKDNEYSPLIKSDNGIFIILRIPISPDMSVAGNTLRYKTAYEYLFNNQIEKLTTKMNIKYEDAYYNIDVKSLPNK